MARIEELTISLIDDFDGTEAAETVKFAIDGKNYEIDLSKPNASELRRTLRPYIDRARAARRTSGARRTTKAATGRRGPARRTEGYDRAEVREWAKKNRVKVAARGRIANEVVERWRQATK
ncbi:MAG TPA: Lsr2 family protein [Acidimicrobiales bacterium]|nr:Lsr2 family protein [Acidimicrobiales bacterium]